MAAEAEAAREEYPLSALLRIFLKEKLRPFMILSIKYAHLLF